jgi:hypothetical protein
MNRPDIKLMLTVMNLLCTADNVGVDALTAILGGDGFSGSSLTPSIFDSGPMRSRSLP